MSRIEPDDEDKVQLKGWIDADVVESFKEFVLKKHGTMAKGLLSFEMEQAIKFYMAGAIRSLPRTNTNTQEKNDLLQEEKTSSSDNIELRRQNNPNPKAWILRNQILDFLYKDKEFNPHDSYVSPSDIYQAPRRHVIRAIEQLRGLDDRTVKKWMQILEKNGIIKFIDAMGNIVEIH